MFLGILTLITALCISAVAIYYSVAGLVAIFAAAALPIMIMGGVLEVGKLVTAVWLHKYWKQATWWLKTYLSVAVVVLMFITSMGIFGFLSKAHIEQTSASEESIARVDSITSEIARQTAIVTRANTRIAQLENSETGADANIQSQIDKEQERIDRAFDRIQPAIAQQNQIIADARTDDATRTAPYEDQLESITAEVLRLEQSARDYEQKISTLETDSSGVEPLLAQIAQLEEEIIRVTNQLNSGERQQIRAGQAIIGVTSDGAFGGNTRRALVTWVSGQRDRIAQIQGEVAQVRKDATTTVDAERVRLAGVVKDIRETQIPALKERELTMLGKIDEVRQTESPAIATARDEIQRLRESAEDQVVNSQTLIERLRQQIGNEDTQAEVQTAIDEQIERVRSASSEIETLTEERIALEAEYRKLEAEVGPIKYIAEFVYGDTADKGMLEEAVRWVIMIIIFVFDPLAVLLLIAAQYTFEFNRKRKDDDGERLRQYERARAQRIVDNPGVTFSDPVPAGDDNKNSVSDDTKEEYEDREETTREEQQDAEELRTGQDEESISTENGHDPDVAETSQEERSIEDVAKDYIRTDDNLGDNVSEDDTTDSTESVTTVEQSEVQANETDNQETLDKEFDNTEELKKESMSLQDVANSYVKSNGKIPPTRNRFFYKEELETPPKKKNDIESLEELSQENKKSYMIKNEDGKQIHRETYIQNGEQSDNSIWQRIKRDKDN